MNNYKRTPNERSDDLLITIELKEKGYSFRKIADYISSIRSYNVTYRQLHISYRSAMKLDPENKEHKEIINKHRNKGIERVELIIDEALDSWDKSKGQVKETIKKGVLNKGKGEESKDLERQEITEKIVDSAGNPAYLNVALKAEERKAKFLGTDAPTRNENINKNIDMSDDDIRRELAKLEAMNDDGEERNNE